MEHAKRLDINNLLKRVLSLFLCIAMCMGTIVYVAKEAEASNYTDGVSGQYYYYAGLTDLEDAKRSSGSWDGFSYTTGKGAHSNAMRITTTAKSDGDRHFYLGTGNTSYSASTYPYLLVVCSASVDSSLNEVFLLNNSLSLIGGGAANSSSSTAISDDKILHYLLFNVSSAGSTNIGGIRFDLMNDGADAGTDYVGANQWIDIYGFAFINSNSSTTITNVINKIFSEYTDLYKFQLKVHCDGSWTKGYGPHFFTPDGASSDIAYMSGNGDDAVTSTNKYQIVNGNQIRGQMNMSFYQYYTYANHVPTGWNTYGSNTADGNNTEKNYFMYQNKDGKDDDGFIDEGDYITTHATTINLFPGTTAVLEIQPVWQATQYTVNFNANGGTGMSKTSQTGAAGTKISFPSITPPTGHSHAGWSTTKTGTVVTSATIPANNSTTYYARWNVNQYTVKFSNTDTNGGTISTASFKGNYNSAVTFPTTTPKTGYSFAGWYTAATGGTKVTSATIPANNTTTYHARWTKNSYTVYFSNTDTNGGTIGSASQKAAYGSAVTFPTTTPKTGYSFAGWWTAATGGSQVTSATIPANNTTTYHARWSKNSYNVTANATTGVTVSGAGSKAFESSVTLTASVATGYHFTGWTGDYTGTSTTLTFTMPAKAVTVQANAAPNTYTVNFNANGGTGSMSGQGFTYNKAQNLTANSFTRAGYTFAGWNTAANGSGTSYSNGQSVSNLSSTDGGTVTLYAQWTANTDTKYTVRYYWQNVENDEYTLHETKEYGGTTDTTITAPKLSYTGFDVPADVEVTISGDGNAVAEYKYNRTKYTVTLNTSGNGIASVKGAGTYKYGAPVTIEAALKVGYENLTWNGTVITTMPASNVTLTASATPIVYTITYSGVNATVSGNPTTYTVESSAITLKNPTRDNYTFTGWTGTGLTGATMTVTIPAGSTGNREYTANWKINGYTITWKNEDGTVLETDTNVAVGTTPTYDGATPTKAATAEYTYTFDKWTPEIVAVTGNATYTATFKATKNKYTITWQDDEGKTIDTTAVEYGVVPTHADVTKAADAQYTYTFKEWSPAVVAVTGDATYTAVFDKTVNKYTITWKNDDDSVIGTTTVEYGKVPTHADATKAATAEYTYTFAGWDPKVVAVTGEATYTATFTATKNTYTITWVDEDGIELDKQTLAYGVTPVYGGNAPTKEGYTFVGWTPEVVAVTGPATYTVVWELAVSTLTISNSGTHTVDENQSYIFDVKGNENDDSTKDVHITIVVHGNDETTVDDLPIGNYTVTEQDAWSWRYKQFEAKPVSVNAGGASVEFTSEREKLQWDSGDSRKEYQLNNNTTLTVKKDDDDDEA